MINNKTIQNENSKAHLHMQSTIHLCFLFIVHKWIQKLTANTNELERSWKRNPLSDAAVKISLSANWYDARKIRKSEKGQTHVKCAFLSI